MYKRMLRDLVAPALRKMGFKGSGSNYSMNRDDWVISLGFQKSRWSTRATVEFDVNVAVAHPATQAAFKAANEEARALGNAFEMAPSGSYWDRLSILAPGREQFGWSVGPGNPPDHVAQDVLACVEEYFLPTMIEQMARPLAGPTPASERPKRPSREQLNEEAAARTVEALRAAGVRTIRRLDLPDR